jgi:hypothetical protein
MPIALAVDGEPIVGERQSLPLYLDPGEHTFSASAPSRKPYEARVTVQAAAQPTALVVHIPVLEAAVGEGHVAPFPRRESAASPPSGNHTAGWIVGGAGVVLIAVAVSFGIDALAETASCGNGCNTTNAETAEAVSLASFGTGLAALAVGAWLLHAPAKPASVGTTVSVFPVAAARGTGLAVLGTF